MPYFKEEGAWQDMIIILRIMKQFVSVECEFYDVRIERSSVPQGLYHYEVAGDDDCGGDPVRVAKGILVNFFGTLISRTELPLDEAGKLWLQDVMAISLARLLI